MLVVLAFTLQLQVAVAAAPAVVADSLHDLERAHDAQAGFERGRRYLLPFAQGSGGRCDVRIGRFCWWYEADDLAHPAEPPEIAERRAELLRELDALGERRPGDAWIAGMRVFYRIDDGRPLAADSAARTCRAVDWWCVALRAWAAHARDDASADSLFAESLAAMPDSTRCAWRDISTLLPGKVRERYEHLGCAERGALETRYWMLATPRLSVPGNEWRAEFYARRAAATLLASALTPHRLSWGRDSEELTLRYGLPVAWSRVQPPIGLPTIEPEILGHDPAPSYHFGPGVALLNDDAGAGDDGWPLTDRQAESRYANPAIRRVAIVAAQVARFRRGDSTLLVAAWSSADDSLGRPAVAIGALRDDGRGSAGRLDSARTGRGQVVVAGEPRLVGVELSDSSSRTLGRTRRLYPPRRGSARVRLSDILLYRPTDEHPPSLDEAVALAIPGDTAAVSRPLGLFWEAYGADSADATVETTIVVERIDRGVFRAARQRLGLSDPDSPLRVRWSEARPPAGGVTQRALALDLSTMPAGRYRITLAMTPASGAGASTEREVELRDR